MRPFEPNDDVPTRSLTTDGRARPEPAPSTTPDSAIGTNVFSGSSTSPGVYAHDPTPRNPGSTVPFDDRGDAGRLGPVASAPPGFEVERELGRGGMGVVYLAKQTGLNRWVALKMIRGDATAAAARARFLAEAEAMAAVRHAHVATVYAYGEHAGSPYLALELLEGGTLGSRLRRLDATAPTFPAAVAALLADVAEGVGAAHAVGVVHRDLKPSNVLLDAAGVAKVTDFGLAKRTRGADLTLTEALIGTPEYMPPEQAKGGAKVVGPTADVWSLGVILFEALAGRRPFAADSTYGLVLAVAAGDAPRLRAAAPTVPADLATVCDKCLAKDPAERYPTAADLAADLRRFVRGEPVAARPLPAARQVARWVRRNRVAAGGLAAAVLALVGLGAGGVAYAAYKSLEADRARDELADVARREGRRAAAGQRLEAARRLRAAGRLDDARAEYVALLALAEHDEAVPAGVGEEVAAVDAERAARQGAQAAREALARLRRARDEAYFHATLFTGGDPGENRATAAAAAAAGLAGFVAVDGRPADPRRFDHLPPAERDEAAVACQELLLVLAETRPACLAAAEGLPGGIGLRTLAARLADERQKAGDAAAAARYRRQAEGLPADRPADRFAAALAAYRGNDLAAARAAADAVARREPNHFWALYVGGVVRVRQGQPAAAGEQFTACLALRPDFDLARVYRGFAAGEQQDFARAFEDYGAALQRSADPTVRFLALNNRGIHRAARGDLDGAEADLLAAKALRPTALAPYRSLAAVRLRRDAAAAVAVLTEAIAVGPPSADLYLDRGRALARTDAAAARADFAAVLALKPSPDVTAKAELELAALDLAAPGRTPAAAALALAAADRAAAAAPTDPAAHRLRATALVELDRPDAAADALDRYFRLAGRAATAADHLLRALLRAKQARYPEAVAAYTAALAGPATPAEQTAARLGRAGVYLLSDAPKLAAADYEAVLAADPKNADARLGRADARVRLGRIADGLADAAAAAEVARTPRQWFLIARTRAVARERLTTEPGLAKRNGLGPDDELKLLAAAAAAVRSAVAAAPAADRRAFWTDRVKADTALGPLVRYDLFRQIEATLVDPQEPRR